MAITPDTIETRLARAAELRRGAETFMDALSEAADLLEAHTDDIVLFWQSGQMIAECVAPLVATPDEADQLADLLRTAAGWDSAMDLRDRILTALGVEIRD